MRTIPITDWASNLFQDTYKDKSISKEDIFYYTYAILSSPEYIARFEQDARKSGPRIPLLDDFWTYSRIGKQLTELHVNPASAPHSSNVEIHISDSTLPEQELYRVQKMSLIRKLDSQDLVYNDHITIRGIPIDIDDFKINARTPLEWIINQYQFSVDKDTGIESDPNNFDSNPRYIVDLILSSISISIETLSLLKSIPPFRILP